jgi:hypothetical protein
LRKVGSENAHGRVQNAENGFGFEFLERYHKDGDEFLKNIARVTDDETWVLFENVETKEQSKQWMHTQSPKKSRNFVNKLFLSARKLMATVFWERKRVLMVEFMQQRITITS